ncbi:MAG: queuosine precursor transporter [Acidobacteriota bacterium]|nr:queuosine precursor transporter [Acidobacteriota bacterium]MXW69885.1 queuosine precursor transporter [Acidobacteriota bacterium]MXX85602.1 queuosine precursor transporter [Acidobacteriota bacterium]MYE43400.1 queuosine precursor transporter [Acidobacteriota bacterium]MYF77384.1 queuosine precursor transporter [Acidobacteriota bacterium]
MDNARVREQVFLTLAAVFIAALIACNLIFRKFFVWEIPVLGLIGLDPQMELSVGILAYPVTFICTDVLSEFYGRRRVSQLVTAGFFASVFVVGLVMLSNWVPAAGWSAVDDATFDLVFGIQGVAVAASMCAYLGAQYLDIRLFHYWKRRTAGRHLWLRNNASTFTSQLVDTILVTTVLSLLGASEITPERLPILIVNGVVFKWFVAVVDTPLVYGAVWFMRNRLGIEEAPADETRSRTRIF